MIYDGKGMFFLEEILEKYLAQIATLANEQNIKITLEMSTTHHCNIRMRKVVQVLSNLLVLLLSIGIKEKLL